MVKNMHRRLPLQYNISNWHQLVDCKSNSSARLHIKVSDFIQDDRLSGTRIAVHHDDFGVIFAYTLNASGTIVNEYSGTISDIMTPTMILNELKKYGFMVTYKPRTALDDSTLKYLMSLYQIGLQYIRIVNVRRSNDLEFYPIAVAFASDKVPTTWMNNGYSPSEAEFNTALSNGAVNVSAMSANVDDRHTYNWSWLIDEHDNNAAVLAIKDIIEENTSEA